MVAHVLAVLLGVGSVGFYVVAFFYPEVHRRSDILLSGAGMLYAALLWFCAGQMTWAVLLTQGVAIALLMVLGWQMLSVRREKTPIYQQTPVTLTPEVVGDWAKNTINQLRIAPVDKVRPLRPQNPSLNGTSADRFRQPIDPRRRPVYDYEFVEDGVADEVPAESAVDDVTALVEEVPTVVPPSAEAEVLVEEVPEVEKPQVEDVGGAIADDEPSVDSEDATAEVDTRSEANADLKLEVSDVIEEAVSDEEGVSEASNVSEADSSVDGDSAEREFSEEESVEHESVENNPIENNSTDTSDDWGFLEEDDFNGDNAVEAVPVNAPGSESFVRSPDITTQPSGSSSSPDPSQRLAQAPTEKPAIWAMPIILVGWVKDVVTSMTKPKPSKPMIEIPRRESVQRVDRDVANEPNLTNRSADGAAVREPSPSPDVSPNDAQADDFMTDSNDDIFDDFNQANWVDRAEDMPKVVVNNRADETVNETIEESNWDD